LLAALTQKVVSELLCYEIIDTETLHCETLGLAGLVLGNYHPLSTEMK